MAAAMPVILFTGPLPIASRPQAAVTPNPVITNGQPRLTVDGQIIDAHDGHIAEYGGVFYLYGTAYGCGFKINDPTTSFCGFNVYTSTDLNQWTGPTQLFTPDGSWQTLCMHQVPAGGGCFRPHTVFDPNTDLYVLWINVPNGYRALTSATPTGPFVLAGAPHIGGGDMTLLSDTDGTGYLVFASYGRIFESRLTADYLDIAGSTTEITGFPQVPPFNGAEAPSLFVRAGTYYLTLSVPQCPYCNGTGTGYFTAPTPAGPWAFQGMISDYSCDGQPAAVSALGDLYLYQSDQWLETANEYAAHQFWWPLTFSGSQIKPLDCALGNYPNLVYLPWYDNATTGFKADNIHIVNPASNGRPALGAVSLHGQQLSFAIDPGKEWIGHFFSGTLGGPVVIGSSVPVLASQRVEFNRSFNEVPAQPAGAAATDLYLAWFDRVSSPSFKADNIHVVNPSPSPATVTVTIPGSPGCSPTAAVESGAEAIFTCATGFGGPVHVHSTAPVLASQRLTYDLTFSEVNAAPAAGATTSYATWYDHASSSLFVADNVHVVAPGGSLAGAGVKVSIPGCPAVNEWRYSSAEWIYSCPFGKGFGGPVVVTSASPVLVSQRVQYGSSFSETPGQDASAAARSLTIAWFDFASSYGFAGDNVHVIAPGGSLSPGQVNVAIPGCSPSAWQASAAEVVYSCTFGHGYGGPVVISSSTPVLASQRVQYYQSFNETLAR